MDHPFHLHGLFFQVVAIDGERVRSTSWEDTVNVVAKKSVTIAVRADNRPGEWMYHCHILEHHAAGANHDTPSTSTLFASGWTAAQASMRSSIHPCSRQNVRCPIR
ncbi:MAG: multicopper oxidase domain-containing protein [Kofleriaceae bacterium]